jgi:hypothetical protein
MNEPKRIQRKRSKGWKNPPNTVYVGRGTHWGNPWHVGGRLGVGREEAIRRYKKVVVPLMRGQNKDVYLDPLRGKNLSCWCPLDQPCHADVLLKIANAA